MHFREQRGTLTESLGTMVTLKDRAELIAHLRRCLAPLPVAEEDVAVRHYTFDGRIGWDTFIVTIAGYGVAGFTDGEL